MRRRPFPIVVEAAEHPPSAKARPGASRGWALRDVWSIAVGNAPLVAAVAFWVVLLVFAMPQELVQDSWLTLLSGREVVQSGLPHVDHLTVWTGGRSWIDQQWLAQSFFYGVFLVGGVRLVLLVHIGLLTAMFGSALIAARRLGASRASVGIVGIAMLGLAPWSMQFRSQTIAECLFVWTVWLLAADSRAPSRRVFLAFPLLILWANVHGTVVLGVALVMLRGITSLLDDARRGDGRGRAIALVTLSPFCLFASPYGLSLTGYYHSLLANPTLRWFIDEWGASTPSHKTVAFFLAAAVTLWLLGRYRERLTLFELLALLLMLVAGVDAIRSIIWFALAGMVLLPALADGALERLAFPHVARHRRIAAGAALASIGVAIAFGATRPSGWYEQQWPGPAARRAVGALACSRSATIFADDRYADWLLWTQPATRGRIAYDVRFELFRGPQFLRLSRYRNRIGADWLAPARNYSYVVMDPRLQEDVQQGLTSRGGFKRRYGDGTMAVLTSPHEHTMTAASCAA